MVIFYSLTLSSSWHSYIFGLHLQRNVEVIQQSYRLPEIKEIYLKKLFNFEIIRHITASN